MEKSETKPEEDNNNNKENSEENKNEKTEDVNENFIKAEFTPEGETNAEVLKESITNVEDANANIEHVTSLDANIIVDEVTDLDTNGNATCENSAGVEEEPVNKEGTKEEIEEKVTHQTIVSVENDEEEKYLNVISAEIKQEDINVECTAQQTKENEKIESENISIDNKAGEKETEESSAEIKQVVNLQTDEQQKESVKFREKKEKPKNKEKRVTFMEQNLEDEENDLNFGIQSAKSNESKVVWEIVSETKGDEIVTEVKNERKKRESEECRTNMTLKEAKQIWDDYENISLEEKDAIWESSNRDKSVFMNFLQERQREKTLSISDFNTIGNDFPTMPYEESTGSVTAQAPPTQCNHMCGSLFAHCGSVRQEALVKTFSQSKQYAKKYEDDSYTGPVSLTEILQERDNLKSSYNYSQPTYTNFNSTYDTWGVIGSQTDSQDRMCRYQEIDEDLESLQNVLMGNGASSSNPIRNDKNGYGLCNVDCNKTSGVLDPIGTNADTYEYIKSGVLSLMKRETKEWENKAVDLNNEVLALQRDVKRKDQEILRLQREVHKLKSVLQQATSFTKDGDLLSTLQEIHGMAGQKVGANNKKQGVSAESSQPNKTATDIHIKRYEKDFRSKQLIKAAIMDNDFLKNLDLSQVRELVESMYPKECSKGSYVIREGEAGAHLYVAAEGEFEVIKEQKVLGRIGPGKAFGELAILYNCTRTASIRVVKDSKVWVLDRRIFQRIMMQTGLQRLEDNIHFLRSVPLLKNLSDDVLAKISDVLEVEFYPSGHHIIRQGANGDTFFILSQGSVKVTQRLQGSTEEQEIRILERGDYFGEQALLKEDCRTASVIALSPGVECLTLDRESFIQLIGDLSELQEKDYGDRTRISIDRPPSSNSINSEPDQELAHIRLEDLDVIATLGVGGFGRVELVQCLYDKSHVFALKCMKKQHIVETHQQEHVYSEKSIMMSCRHPFIGRLYKTFKDSKYVYMLMEACLGGEVWTILRDRGCFDDSTCCFITACVVEALHYLHTRGIVFRDLKPENLLLDSQGYVKLVDFGFAKRLGISSTKTWTFCGTPEYVAPEIILNKGHDKAVDCWALGILIHELLTGAPPFSGSDPMKIYNMILKGIDMVDFPRHVTRTAQALIKKLCRDSPAERLGCQKGGFVNIKKNKWFQGFDWDGLRQRTLVPPIVPQVRSPTDTANFDQYPKEIHIPEDETSNWDADF